MLSSKYNSQEVEEKIGKFWESRPDFKAEDASNKPPYCIILPPPNVTGFLHIGHALNHTIQDVLIRWKRMSGFNTLWLPGTDHAGISTQTVVEKKLMKEGSSRLELGREEFEKKVWEWKEEFGSRIVSQMKRIGDSCDWDRLTFTLDDNVSKAVKKVFVDLYEKGHIYRGRKLVNWSPKLQTAISDIEVEHKEIKGSMWHIKYRVEGTDQDLVVATTRPETFLGDTAVAVHPEDERYRKLVGKKVSLPLTGRKIEVIADEYVEKDFGTGVVKITPAHDFNDYEVGLRHDLEQINLLNTDGTLNENAGVYKGLHVQEARKKIVEDLEAGGFIEKIEPHKQSVGHCERTGCVVEPYLSEQWFVKMEKLSIPAIRAVESGTTEFTPSLWEKTYFNWLKNIQDWCISRQLWWGHRIPVWHCDDCNKENVTEAENLESCTHCGSKNLTQDPDVLDTWFSSALWPFSTMGWPEKTEALKTFYPTDVLVTGPDIIFFWVARMMMQGLEYMEDVPFRHVYFNGLVRDSQGRKMSKSLGNSVDPVELVENYGADALRFTLMSQLASGKDIKFSIQRLEGYRNFINKIWNATRFYLTLAEDNKFEFDAKFLKESKDKYSIYDQWILKKLDITLKDVNKKLENFRFSEATSTLYAFVWNDLCDWYLEFSKLRVYGEDAEDKKINLSVLSIVLDHVIKLLHPFIPFVTEEIYSNLPTKNKESMALSKYPDGEEIKALIDKDFEISEVELIKDLITSIRNIRGENRIKVSQPLDVNFSSPEEATLKLVKKNQGLIHKLALIGEMSFEKPDSYKNKAVNNIKCAEMNLEIAVPLEGIVDISEEIQRVEKVIAKAQSDRKKLEAKLSNKKFLENAPEDLVEEDKEKLKDTIEHIEFLTKHRSRLSV